jgi:hypothetical protein
MILISSLNNYFAPHFRRREERERERDSRPEPEPFELGLTWMSFLPESLLQLILRGMGSPPVNTHLIHHSPYADTYICMYNYIHRSIQARGEEINKRERREKVN